MKNRRTFTTTRRLGTGLVVGLLALATGAVTARADIIQAIIVKVNGDIFTKTDLEARQFAALRQKGEEFDPKVDPKNAALKKALDEITPQLLVQAVDELLLVQRGKDLGYALTDDQFNSIVDNIKKSNHIETQAQWDEALKQEHMTMADLRDSLENQMLMTRVEQNEVFDRIAVSDQEAKQYYESHLAAFTAPPQVTLREILVAVPDTGKTISVGADDAAKAKAEEIRKRIMSGQESFEKAAAAESDSPSKANAGLIGPLNVPDLSAGIQKLLADMKPGDVTPILRTPRGYQILQLVSRTPAKVTPFDKAREQISGRVFTKKRQEAFAAYLKKLRSQAIIQWENAPLEKAYEEGLKQGDQALMGPLSSSS